MSAPTRAHMAASRLRLPRQKPSSTRGLTAYRPLLDDLQWPQRTPLGDYYTSILRDRAPRPDEAHRAADPTPEKEPTPQERARIIFGSRLLGPAERADRLARRQAQSTYVEGVLVPPQPDEPDNCCMSGCVNCVWDRYREDMEEWSAKKKEAQARLEAQTRAAAAGDDAIASDMWDQEVYRGVPVGIREFMKQEKRLKEKHAREGTIGG